MEELNKKICSGLEMVIDKSIAIGKEKKEWSLVELGEASDIIKDMAEASKDLAKAHYYLSEHPTERY